MGGAMTSASALGGATTATTAEDKAILKDCVAEEVFAAEIGLTTRTLRRWRALGIGLPCTRLGRTNYYHVPTCRAELLRRAEQSASA